ncbi:rhomboid family intramembrane serine protease [Paenibacillus aurantius]|uniref:Rhomboid family intramembrane serine protease n=1 Tax=Paenibacillus aurantius TaxID=2918900 RepID=A0AA96RF87_9BACL|nr:rhomboid family intramembrane serine protease [Paenibacillus aurantius]WNQ11201.1 rhomboid family intramembrane serine protease [Paenibacillus aurantius]
MQFVRYESLRQYLRFYPVTSLIILINLVMFLIMEGYGSSRDPETLLKFGAMFSAPGFAPEWWRYVTAMFLHIGFEHLLFNMFALFVFAPPLERLIGHFRYAVFYLLSGVAGSAVSYGFQGTTYLGAGASGAIYGIYAAYLFFGLFRRDLQDKSSSQTVVLILVLGVIYSFVVPRVDLYAHLGGAVAGFLLAAVFSVGIRRLK